MSTLAVQHAAGTGGRPGGAGAAPGPHPRLLPPTPRRVAVTGVVLTAAWLATHELDRLIGGLPDAHDRASTLAGVASPGAWSAQAAWVTWSAGPGGLRPLLLLHVLAGVACFVSAGLLLSWAVRRCARALAVVGLYLALQVAETGLLVLAVGALDRRGAPDVPTALGVAVAATALLKWAVLAVALLLAVTSRQVRAATWTGLVRVAQGLYFQRLSLVVVAVVALLALVPGPNVWDQVPDVQRGWVADCPDLLGGDCPGGLHGLVAVVVAWVLAAGLLLLGRQRAELATAATDPGYTAPAARATAWWAVPAAASALAVGLGPLGLDVVGVDPPLWPFVLGPLLLLALSLGPLRDAADPEPWPGLPPHRAGDVRSAGDALALALPVVLLLALVRAYTSLSASVLVRGGAERGAAWAAATVLLLLAVPAALLVVLRGDRLAARVARWQARPGGVRRTVGDLLDPDQGEALRSPLARLVPAVAWALSLLALGLLLLAPLSAARALGVLGTALLCLGLWSVVLGIAQVRLQKRRPLPVFRWFGLRATPLLTLLVALPALTAVVLPIDRDLHEVRSLGGTSPRQQPLAGVVADWARDTADCTVPWTVPGQSVQPLLLVAASGGGIRAAYWTAHLMDRLQQHGPCGTAATLLSSGVSGGAVGLALSRDGSGVAAVERMADPDALGAATAGLLVGDLLAGTTGLRVPALLDGQRDWRDRAGLMELSWEAAAPDLAGRFDRVGDGPAGALVLNSAAAGVGCRVLVSQVALGAAAPPQPGVLVGADEQEQAAAQCTRPTSLPAASVDLHDLYAAEGCAPPVLRLGTAAMLAARFPTVTPGGRMPVTDCPPRPDVQLVDGGYGESSGVGTLADVAPRLAALLRARNARPGGTVVVPLVVFLEEEPRTDLAPAPRGLAPEALVPLAGLRAGAAQTASGTWLQRASAALQDVCPAGGPGAPCRRVVEDVRQQLPAGAVVVAPRTQPDVDAPLGWTLSGASRERLRSAMDEQARPDCRPVGGYGCLGQLLELLPR